MADLVYNSFKEYMADGTIDLDTHAFKVMLTTTSYTQAATHTSYASVTNQVASGSGYTTGGAALASVTWAAKSGDATTMVFDAVDTAWTSATFTAAKAVVYDDAVAGDPLVCCFDFGGSKTVSAGTFTLQYHASGLFTLA